MNIKLDNFSRVCLSHDYKLVPADSRVDQEVNLNCANLSQDLGQAPEAFLPDSAQEGKPRCIMPYFPSYYSFIYL